MSFALSCAVECMRVRVCRQAWTSPPSVQVRIDALRILSGSLPKERRAFRSSIVANRFGGRGTFQLGGRASVPGETPQCRQFPIGRKKRRRPRRQRPRVLFGAGAEGRPRVPDRQPLRTCSNRNPTSWTIVPNIKLTAT